MGRVKGLHSICSRVCGVRWCGVSWVYLVFSHAIILARPLSVPFDVTSEGSKVGVILARPFSVPFDVTSEGSKVGVGKDVGMLGQDVSGIVLESLLPDCPVSHRLSTT